MLREAETAALTASIARLDRLVTSVVGVVELVRAARRVLGEPGARAAELVAAGLTVISVTPEVAARARLLGPAELRTLDAIHLATALEVGGELPFCCYERRLADAAVAVGLHVVRPGA